MEITCISDLHGHYPTLEGGDLLIVAGDLTARDHPAEYLQFYIWLHKQEYNHYIIVPGNHDNLLQTDPELVKFMAYTSFLVDSGTEFEGLKIFGSPWSKTFEGMNPLCKAFTVDTEDELAEKWALISEDVDILVTHSPPLSVLDRTIRGKNVGSSGLAAIVGHIEPKLHIFGHVHESYGRQYPPQKDSLPAFFEVQNTIFVNASHVNEFYQPVNKPIRVIL